MKKARRSGAVKEEEVPAKKQATVHLRTKSADIKIKSAETRTSSLRRSLRRSKVSQEIVSESSLQKNKKSPDKKSNSKAQKIKLPIAPTVLK